MCTHELFPAHRVQFKHLNTLGQGNFSTVDEVEPSGRKVLPSRIYARKVFALKRHLNRVADNAGLDIAKALYHPHTITTVMTYEETFGLQSLNYGIIMSPVANCTLRVFLERVVSSEPIPLEPLPCAQKWLGCLASGLSYIHAKGLLHKDIRPSSIGVKNGEIFFTEFAISNFFKESNMLVQEISDRGSAKSDIYLAPEIDLRENSSSMADVFSLGCIFLEMLTAAAGISLEKINEGLNGRSLQPYGHHSTTAIEWLIGLRDRLRSPFLQQFLSYCQTMLQLDHHLRPSAFMVAKSIYDLDEKVSRGIPELAECRCLSPWQGRKDEDCQLVW
jgi:serine/threonine protein kinase